MADDEQVRTFQHSVKGTLTGVVVGEDDTWLHLRLVGDHDRGRMYNSEAYRESGVADDGEVLTVRKSRLTEVTG